MTNLINQSDPYQFPSVMRELDFSVYKEIEALNAHGASTILDRSLAHFRFERDNPKEATKKMTAGTLLHEIVLEPDKQSFRVAPEGAGKNSKVAILSLLEAYAEMLGMPVDTAGKMDELRATAAACEQEIEARGLYLVSHDQMAQAIAMRDGLMRKPIIRALLEDGGDSEVTMLWKHPEFGCPCKGRIDYLPAGHAAIADLKTTTSAGFSEFMRTIGRYDYHLQTAHYCQGAEILIGKLPYLLLVVESEPPYEARHLMLAPEDIRRGEAAMRVAASRYAEALRTNRWDAYPNEIEVASVPGWAK